MSSIQVRCKGNSPITVKEGDLWKDNSQSLSKGREQFAFYLTCFLVGLVYNFQYPCVCMYVCALQLPGKHFGIVRYGHQQYAYN